MIADSLRAIRSSLPDDVVLVAVSKTKPVELLMQAYDAGQRVFGENKVQEMADKAAQMPKDIEWHMIGHVQTNKVKYMAPFVSLIHGVDSLKVLGEINKQAAKNNRIQDVLLQIHIATEETKFGLDEAEMKAILASDEFAAMKNVRVRGLMGMASFTDDSQQIVREFTHLKSIYDQTRADYPEMDILSMGMSGD
ncbi:MAG TPA: YggS family pyridoxal phosphate-dependent enzyme, partial [Flavobacterium sp.]|nr:YggS family pyridoxal phosphate-dependent enzyme [Flavobacterium sp.]